MQAVLIAMTIFGRNDAVTQCNYVATVDRQWQTVAMCDADSEKQLKGFTNAKYPTVIAICEEPKPAAAAAVVVQPAAPPVQSAPETGFRAYAAHVAERVRAGLPTGQGIKETLVKPVHFVSNGYSWVAQRLTH
jgi:hypothetical protein